jgi:hypothetical protein
MANFITTLTVGGVNTNTSLLCQMDSCLSDVACTIMNKHTLTFFERSLGKKANMLLIDMQWVA